MSLKALSCSCTARAEGAECAAVRGWEGEEECKKHCVVIDGKVGANNKLQLPLLGKGSKTN